MNSLRLFAISTCLGVTLCSGALPALKLSDNKRFLVTDDGKPFFYLGDTTWELFHRLNREQAVQLFENRAARKFNVLRPLRNRPLAT